MFRSAIAFFFILALVVKLALLGLGVVIDALIDRVMTSKPEANGWRLGPTGDTLWRIEP